MKYLKLLLILVFSLLLIGCSTNKSDTEEIVIPKVEQIEQYEQYEQNEEIKKEETQKIDIVEIDEDYMNMDLINLKVTDGTLNLYDYLTKYEVRDILEYILKDEGKLITFINCILEYTDSCSDIINDDLLKSFEIEMIDMNFEQKCLENFSNININSRTQLDLDKLFLNKNVVARCYYLLFLLDDNITNKNINTVIHNLSRDIMYTLYFGTAEELKNLLEEDKDISIYTDITDLFEDESYILRDDYDYKEIDLENGDTSMFEFLFVKAIMDNTEKGIVDRKAKLQVLIDKGYNINRNLKKGTPLMGALYYGDTEAISVLLENGANINERKRGVKPIQFLYSGFDASMKNCCDSQDICDKNIELRKYFIRNCYLIINKLDEESKELLDMYFTSTFSDKFDIGCFIVLNTDKRTEPIFVKYFTGEECANKIQACINEKTIEERVNMLYENYLGNVLNTLTVDDDVPNELIKAIQNYKIN